MKKKNLLFLISLALLYSTTTVASTEVIQVDFTGSFLSSGFFGIVDSADMYETGDTIVGQLIYHTEAYDEYFQSDLEPEESEWFTELKSLNAVMDFSLSIFRNGQPYNSPDLSQYPQHRIQVTAESTMIDDSTMGSFHCWLNDDRSQISFPEWFDTIHMVFDDFDAGYTVPYTPSLVLNTEDYIFTPLLYISKNHFVNQSVSDGGWNYVFTLDSVDVTIIPEPTTLSLLAIGAFLAGRKRKKLSVVE